jgi:membrane protein implicated in regulation of membrane protease activity
MDSFDRVKYVQADLIRGKAMLASFSMAAFIGFLSGLLPSGNGYIGMLLLFVVLIAAVYIIHRARHETKKSTDYLLVFFITLVTFLGFWTISLNIP